MLDFRIFLTTACLIPGEAAADAVRKQMAYSGHIMLQVVKITVHTSTPSAISLAADAISEDAPERNRLLRGSASPFSSLEYAWARLSLDFES
jgi:hypothetical protein